MINRTSLALYSKPRKGGVFAMSINEGDELIQAKISNGNDNIIMATSGGKSIRFTETAIRATGRRTKGVKGITTASSDAVIGMLVSLREITTEALIYRNQWKVELYLSRSPFHHLWILRL